VDNHPAGQVVRGEPAPDAGRVRRLDFGVPDKVQRHGILRKPGNRVE
jgi:hypothetical protein